MSYKSKHTLANDVHMDNNLLLSIS